VLTVGQITQRIKQTLETGFPRVWVQGELSNVKRHTSGHLYFTLKDDLASISGVMWRSRVGSLTLTPEDGQKVVVRGSITVYPPRGAYQIDADQIKPVGLGELQRRFEALKQKLAAEGLFDAARKRPLPVYPKRIGIVTSESGAALQDMRTVLRDRMPSVGVLLMPVRVQGAGAAAEIAAGIEALNAHGTVDVIIVGRGGGSMEDLWAFNEEVVARAIAASRIPVVTAVGHEIDFTIADFVADHRAPTPTAAAQHVVRDSGEILADLGNLWYTLRRRMEEMLRARRDRLSVLSGSYALNRPRDLLREFSQRLDEQARALMSAADRVLELARHRQSALSGRLQALDPKGVLHRGYAIVHASDGLRTRAADVRSRESVRVEFQDGSVRATLNE
jgi:exodeoxyribonuclease VII large subunit